jgi:hypothetical protein
MNECFITEEKGIRKNLKGVGKKSIYLVKSLVCGLKVQVIKSMG